MKKLVIAAIALMTLSTVNAQEDEIRFGAKAGLNVATLVGDGTGDLDSKVGFHIGALAEIPLSDKFAVQPELVFSTQGAKYEESGYESSSNVNYLNLPVMAKFYVAEGFSIQAGPQIGFLMSAKAKAEFEGESESEDIKDITKSIDFGLNFGLGYQLEQGIFFDARYNLGLSNIDDSEFSDSDYPVKNAVFQISVGYKF